MINPFSFKICPFVQRVLDDIGSGNWTNRNIKSSYIYRWNSPSGEMEWYLDKGILWGARLRRGDQVVPLTLYEDYLLTKHLRKMRQEYKQLLQEEAQNRPDIRS